MLTQEFIDARKALEQAEAAEKPQYVEIGALRTQAAALEAELQARLRPFQEAFQAAREHLLRCLTPWDVRQDGGLYHHRYRLEPDPPNPTWDTRAWVRRMRHDDGVRRPTLDYQLPDGDQCVTLEEGSVEAVLRAADQVLIKAGWTLL